MNSYYKYYLEIKNRFILLFLNWIFLIIICFSYKDTLLFTITDLNNSQETLDIKPYFIFTNVTEMFYVYLELSFFIANQITLIILLYHSLMFLSLGLYKSEFLKLRFALKFFLIFWLGSFLLFYKFVIPFSWSFFLSFQDNPLQTQPVSFMFEAKIGEYLTYFKSLYYICLMNCQLLAGVTFFLANLSERPEKTQRFRKLFYLLFVLFSTITTPPDIISQVLISLLLILIYELLIFLRYLKISMVTN